MAQAPKQISKPELDAAMLQQMQAAKGIIRQPSDLTGDTLFPNGGMEVIKGYTRAVLSGATGGYVEPPVTFSDDFRRDLFHGVKELLKRTPTIR